MRRLTRPKLGLLVLWFTMAIAGLVWTTSRGLPAPPAPPIPKVQNPKRGSPCDARHARLDVTPYDAVQFPLADPSWWNLRPLPECTRSYAPYQEQYVKTELLQGSFPTNLPAYCTDGSFLLSRLHRLSPQPAGKTFIEVGANKGYGVVEFFSLWTNFTENTVFQSTSLPRGCPWFADVDVVGFPLVVAFEPHAATFQLLKQLREDLPLCFLQLQPEAVSDHDGHVPFDGSGYAGMESHGVLPKGGDVVPSITLDTFASREGITHIDVLTMDAEGHDGAILRGAQRLLQTGSIDLVIFEQNTMRPDLALHVDRIATHGYQCYFMGARRGDGEPRLALLTNGCFRSVFRNGGLVGNVACVRRAWTLAHALVDPFVIRPEDERDRLEARHRAGLDVAEVEKM